MIIDTAGPGPASAIALMLDLGFSAPRNDSGSSRCLPTWNHHGAGR